MLFARFRTVYHHLARALSALVERGQEAANAAVAAIEAAATMRRRRLRVLMDRFEAGLIIPRVARKAAVPAKLPVARKVAARVAPPWPAHRGAWLALVGCNHPSYAVRYRWRWPIGGQPHAGGDLACFAASLRALVEGDAAMRGLLEASAEARRLTRWFLRSADKDRMPAILIEPPRPARPRRPRMARPRPARAPGLFESPPDNLSRDEREARGMPVTPAIRLYDLAGLEFFPTRDQLRR